ncbi:MAG: Lrp/AsnC ligand binding domain-containing protein, partial [Alistipes sp.]|nr:Lrp/AsnC ligand binding domain-containing protein [Alistipes sp.]
YDTCAYIGLTLKDDSRFESVIEALKSIPEIVEVHCTNEAYDLFVKIYARNNEHLLALIQTQLKPLGLSQSKIIISFKVVYNKQLTILPK